MRFTQHLRARATAVLTTSTLVVGGLTVAASAAPAAAADVSTVVAPARPRSPPMRCRPPRSTASSGTRPSSATPSTPAAVRQRPPGRGRRRHPADHPQQPARLQPDDRRAEHRLRPVPERPGQGRRGLAGRDPALRRWRFHHRQRGQARTASRRSTPPRARSSTTFAPNLNATVNAIVATDTAVYVGGIFTTASGPAAHPAGRVQRHRRRPAGWAPAADATVNAMVPVAGRLRSSSAARSRTSTDRRPTAWPRSTRTIRRTDAVERHATDPQRRPERRDPEPDHRRHGRLRQRLPLRRRRQPGRHLLRRPGHREHHLGRGLPRRHLRRLLRRYRQSSTPSATRTTAATSAASRSPIPWAIEHAPRAGLHQERHRHRWSTIRSATSTGSAPPARR